MADTFEEDAARGPSPDGETLVVDVDGFEGPLDLLLELARRQKVDLAKISILALAEQYLTFVEEARLMRLELAADYLVMAAWLAYLKSRLLLPEPPKDAEPPAADLAAALAFRLKRLEAMRGASAELQARPHLNRDIFPRGMAEGVRTRPAGAYEATLYDLLSAYSHGRLKVVAAHVDMPARQVWTLAEARQFLERMIGPAGGWASLDDVLSRHAVEPSLRSTMRASSFSAMLELAREGWLDLRQEQAFGALYLRSRRDAGARPEAGRA
jgi:segregation and condensation protein A